MFQGSVMSNHISLKLTSHKLDRVEVIKMRCWVLPSHIGLQYTIQARHYRVYQPQEFNIYWCPENEILKQCSSLHTSEKSFPEWHYGAFCQKYTPLNSYNICKSCGGNITHLQFREQLYRDLTVLFNEGDSEVHGVTKRWPSNSETQRPEVKHSLHWQSKERGSL
jgi:hypothetical protein